MPCLAPDQLIGRMGFLRGKGSSSSLKVTFALWRQRMQERMQAAHASSACLAPENDDSHHMKVSLAVDCIASSNHHHPRRGVPILKLVVHRFYTFHYSFTFGRQRRVHARYPLREHRHTPSQSHTVTIPEIALQTKVGLLVALCITRQDGNAPL